MRIDVTYADRAPRVVETSGEAMLSASTVAAAPEWRGTGLPVTSVMLRPRTDLLARGDTGLVVELCGWSTATDGWGDDVTVSDFGRDTEVPRLQFHVFRTWDVLPAEDVAHAVDIQIDGRVHVHRIGGRLLDLTCYERVEERLLSHAERNGHPLHQRVMLVHDRLRRESDMTDAEVGASYGLGTTLFDYALVMAGPASDDESFPPTATPVPHDDLDGFADAYDSAIDDETRIAAVMDAMLADPNASVDGLRHAPDIRQIDASDLDDIWTEAEVRLTDERAWGDLDWDELG